MEYNLLLPNEVIEQINQAVNWYEEINPDLGTDFIFSLEETLNLIHESPLSFALYVFRFRRRNIKRFPFAIIYEVKNEDIIVVGFLHQSSDIYGYLDKV